MSLEYIYTQCVLKCFRALIQMSLQCIVRTHSLPSVVRRGLFTLLFQPSRCGRDGKQPHRTFQAPRDVERRKNAFITPSVFQPFIRANRNDDASTSIERRRKICMPRSDWTSFLMKCNIINFLTYREIKRRKEKSACACCIRWRLVWSPGRCVLHRGKRRSWPHARCKTINYWITSARAHRARPLIIVLMNNGEQCALLTDRRPKTRAAAAAILEEVWNASGAHSMHR